jgi:hypothetical protein
MRDPKTRAQVGTVALVAAVVVFGGASPARAAPTSDPAAAEQLFEHGKALLKADDWPGACAKFQASMDLDPAVGTLLKLARCHEHDGQLARALADYQAALALNRRKPGQTAARRAELEAFTTSALDALRPKVPRLRIVVQDKPAGLRITRNGQPLPVAALDEELPVDPGPLEILAEAPGYAAVSRTETAVAGRVTEVAITLVPVGSAIPALVPLEPSAPGSPPAIGAPSWPPPLQAPPLQAPPPQAPPAVSRSPREVQRATGVTSLLVGAVAGAVAAGYGIDTLVKVSQSGMYCDATNHCSPNGIDLRNEARDSQTRGFVSLGVGATLVALGVALVVTALPPRHGAPRVASSPPALVW